jgi:hypothetical protein
LGIRVIIFLIILPLSNRESGFVMQFFFWDGRDMPLLYFVAGQCNCILPEENASIGAVGMMVIMMMVVHASIPVIFSISPSTSLLFCNS